MTPTPATLTRVQRLSAAARKGARTRKRQRGARATHSVSRETPHPAAGCSRAQIAAFEAIAVNCDGGHHPAVLAALERKGLIVGEEVTMQPTPEFRFPMTVKRYHVPLPLHAQWCQWCDENLPDPL